jgi:hypothetical protein
MGTATCWNCDYSLEGLAPGPSGVVVCPECSLEQKAVEGPPARPRSGYLVGLFVSVVVQAVCLISSYQLWALHGRERSLSYQFMVILALFAPVIGTLAGIAAIMLARRRQADSRRGPWRMLGLIIVTLLTNGVIWLALVVIAFFTTSNNTNFGF